MRLNDSPRTLADFHTRKGDTIFSLGACETTVRFAGDCFLILYVDVAGGVQSIARKTDAFVAATSTWDVELHIPRWQGTMSIRQWMEWFDRHVKGGV